MCLVSGPAISVIAPSSRSLQGKEKVDVSLHVDHQQQSLKKNP